MIGQLSVQSNGALASLGRGLVEDLLPVLAQGSGPVSLLPTPADEDLWMSPRPSLLPPPRCMGEGQLVDDQSCTHVCVVDLTQRAVPYQRSSLQRLAAAGDFLAPII